MFDKNLMKLEGMRAVLGALAVLALLQAACVIGWSTGLSRAVSSLWGGAGWDAAFPGLVLFAVCFSALQLVRFAQETMLDRYSLKRARELRDKLLELSFSSESPLPLRIGAPRVAALANDGIDEIQTYLRLIEPKMVDLVVVPSVLLVFVFTVDWPSGVILAVMFPVTVFFMRLLGGQAREYSQLQYGRYTRLTAQFMDTLRGLPVLKAFRASRAEAERVYASSEDLRRATLRTLRTATLTSAVLDLACTFGVAAVAIMLAFRLMDGSLVLYTGLVALIVAPEFFAPIRSYAADFHSTLDGKNTLADVLSLLQGASAPSRVQKADAPQAEDALQLQAGDAPQADGSRAAAGPSVTFDDVTYIYEDGSKGVEGLAFSAAAPEKIAVIGKSGAGKSTVAGLFAGFLSPTSGSVDTSAGWAGAVRYIPQNPRIFRMTIGENVSFYRPDAPRAEVEAVVRAVGLDELVASLPDGLDTPVGEGRRGLSGGEAHRVALARIMLDAAAQVLVFDEPTAHLDVETERDLKGPMLAAMEGKLVLFATHRRHWIDDMDRVLVLDDGRIVEGEAVS